MDKRQTLVGELTSSYINAATGHRKATLEGKANIANKQYAILKKIYDQLAKDETLIDEVLIPLLNNTDHNVRSWAAAHSLGLRKNIELAEKILKEVAAMENIGIIRFNAEMTLRVWREQGYLKF